MSVNTPTLSVSLELLYTTVSKIKSHCLVDYSSTQMLQLCEFICDTVHVYSIIMPSGKMYIIVEFCEKGNLLQFLRSKRGDLNDTISMSTLVSMSVQVANGMEFLTSKKV